MQRGYVGEKEEPLASGGSFYENNYVEGPFKGRNAHVHLALLIATTRRPPPRSN
jgi:hypothetical protein